MSTPGDVPDRPELDDATIAFAGRVFHYARTGDAGELQPLLEAGLPANIRNDKGDSLLMLASYHGAVPLVTIVLQHGGDPELVNDRGQTPLAAAAFKGDLAVMEALLAGGADVNGCGPDRRTALFTAAMFDRTDAVALLLGHGAMPDWRDVHGLSAADAARLMGATETPDQLVRDAGPPTVREPSLSSDSSRAAGVPRRSRAGSSD